MFVEDYKCISVTICFIVPTPICRSVRVNHSINQTWYKFLCYPILRLCQLLLLHYLKLTWRATRDDHSSSYHIRGCFNFLNYLGGLNGSLLFLPPQAGSTRRYVLLLPSTASRLSASLIMSGCFCNTLITHVILVLLSLQRYDNNTKPQPITLFMALVLPPLHCQLTGPPAHTLVLSQ